MRRQSAAMKTVLQILFLVAAARGSVLSFRLPRLNTTTLMTSRVSGPFSDDTQSTMTAQESMPEFRCVETGSFPVQGSSRAFYQCEDLPGQGLTVNLCTCPLGSTFEDALNTCNSSSHGITRPECVSREDKVGIIKTQTDLSVTATQVLHRPKRFIHMIFSAIGLVTTLFSVGRGLKEILSPKKIDLTKIENRLDGVDARLKRTELSISEMKMENALNSKLTQNLIKRGMSQNQINFDITHTMIGQSILENRIHAATTQGLIIKGNFANEFNFKQVQGSINDVKKLIDTRMDEAKSDMEKGFQSISEAIDRSRTEPLVSKILTCIKEYNQKAYHLQAVQKHSQKAELTRPAGYIAYLQSSVLMNTLRDIIHQKFAVPTNTSDISAIPILDLLVDGLQVHVSMMSSLISSYIYLSGEELKQRNLEEFNTYMQRAISSISEMEINLGYDTGNGLGVEIDEVLNEVQQLPYRDQIEGLTELLSEKKSDISQLKSQIKSFITQNSYLAKPGQIKTKLDFDSSSTPLPIGQWQNRALVSYAIQLVSNKGVSEIGEWTRPYTIITKGNPIVTLPSAGPEETRLVYRKFNTGTPELVAIVTDSEESSFRDIARDLINAASRSNEDLAMLEIQALLDDGANVNSMLENAMTCLHYAAKYGNVRVMELLLSKTADLHAKTPDDKGALHFAALHNQESAIEFLINKGSLINAPTNQLGWTPLHLAVVNDYAIATRTLLEHNADINAQDKAGLTPLHLSSLGNGEAMDVLLAHSDINLNAKAQDGQTPLHYAAQNSNPRFVKKLMEHDGIDVNAYSEGLLSPLHYAAMGSNKEAIDSLIEHGASTFIFDKEGSSPLHYAVFYGNEDATSNLIDYNPSIESVKNWENQYAMDMAVITKRSVLMELLKNVTEIENNQFYQEFLIDTGISLSNVHCTREVTTELAKQSEESCIHVGHINNYANILKTKNSLPVHDKFSQATNLYNVVLQNAKSNALSWKQQDGPLRSIEKAILAAKKFEDAFERRYFTKQRNLHRSSDGSISSKLEELITFLELVKNDANAVVQIVANANEECLNLHSVLDTDIKKFEETWQDAKNELKLIGQGEGLAQSTKLRFMKASQQNIENDILAFQQNMLGVYNRTHETYKDLRSVRMQILLKFDHIPTERFATTIPSPVTVIIAEPLLLRESSQEKMQIETLMEKYNQENKEIEQIETRLETRENLLFNYHKLIMMAGGSTEIGRDLVTFRSLDCNLKDILEVVPSLKSSVSEVSVALQKIERNFNTIIQSFNDMINTGRKATTETEKENAVKAINKDLSEARCYWKDTGVQLADLKECSKNFYFIYPEPQHRNKC